MREHESHKPGDPFLNVDDFKTERECVLNLALEGDGYADNRKRARAFVARILTQRETQHLYRVHVVSEISVEDDLRQLLRAFHPGTGNPEPENPLAVAHLKKIRRWALGRYAFCLAWQVDDLLYQCVPADRWWHLKDYLLPKTAFAMLIGYGAMLGAGNTLYWLGRFDGWGYGLLLAACLAAMLGLIHVNVREQIGSDRATNSRTAIVFAMCLAWLWLGVGLIALLRIPAKEPFQFGQAVLASAVALLAGIVGQFFFTGNRSMADPL